MGVGDADDLDRVIAGLDHHTAALDDAGRGVALIDRLHVAQAEMGVGAQVIPHLAAEQAPDRHVQRLAEDVPEREFDAAHRGHADHAQAPEAVLGQDLLAMLDIARVLADQQRC
jgi:hypothetical protein